MSATTRNLRNVALLGHGGDGKTSLAESMLYLTGGTDRLGKVADGNTISDFDPEEIKRQISISSSLLPITMGEYKLNILDTPGYFDFVGEVIQSLRVCDSGVIVLSAKSGIGVGTEKAWKALRGAGKPAAFFVSKLDEEHADFYKVFSSLRDTFGISVCPVTIPIVEGEKTVGIVDIVTRKAYKAEGAKVVEMPVPGSMESIIEEYYGVLAENVAETSEDLMDKYFGGEVFTPEELKKGIREGVISLSLTPVFCGSAVTGLGTTSLLQGIVDYMPSILDIPAETGKDASGADVEIKADADGKPVVIVFKTLSDQYGKFSFFRVVSGKVTSDMTLVNPRTGTTEKLGHIYSVKGKKNTEVTEVICGDIGSVSKLTDTKTGDTLCDPKSPVTLTGITYPTPCYSQAFYPTTKGGEEKMASGLFRLMEEDLSFTVVNNPETRQIVVTGVGDIHLDVLCSRLKSRFGVDVKLENAKVPYREKIRKKVKVQGRHKKQSGGHGQFGDVWIEFEPQMETEDLIFEEKIFGGSVPKNYHPAVEKGLRDCIAHGVLAGYPVVNLKATLVDGSYHEVDSSEMAFKIAASLAYKAGLPIANPVILEPIGALKVTIPDSYMGDIIGDLNKRRGRVMGMNPTDDGLQIVEAEVPMAEMSSYAIDLRSMTQGRGSFTFEFVRYEEAPANIQEKVIAEAKIEDAE